MFRAQYGQHEYISVTEWDCLYTIKKGHYRASLGV